MKKQIYYGWIEKKYANKAFKWSSKATGDSELIPTAEAIYRFKSKYYDPSCEKIIKITVEILER